MFIEDLYDEVAQRVPATPPLIESAVNTALGRFLRGSTAWRVQASFQADAEKTEYDLSGLADSGLICAITELRQPGASEPIGATTVRDLDRRVPGWRLAKGLEPRAYIAQREPHLMRIFPVLTEPMQLDIELALYCTPTTVEIPDWIGEMYRNELIEGACGVLYRIPKKSWTDMALSKDCDEMVDAAARAARARIEKSHTRAIVTANFTPFDAI